MIRVFRRWLSLRVWLAAWLTAAVLIPFAALAPIALRARKQAAHEGALREVAALAHAASRSMSTWLRERQRELAEAASGISPDSMQAGEVARRIRSLDEANDFFSGILLAGADDRVAFSTMPSPASRAVAQAALQSAAGRGRGGFYAVRTRASPLETTVLLAVPLAGANESGGLLIARVTGLDSLLRSLQPGEAREALLTDSAGRILAGPIPAARSEQAGSLSGHRIAEPLRQPGPGGRASRAATAGSAIIASAPVPGTTWTLSVRESANIAYAPVRRLALWLGIVLVALLGAAILAGSRLASGLAGAIAELKQFLQRVPPAGSGERLPSGSLAEMTSLKAAANEMVARLELSQQEMERRLEELRRLSQQLSAVCQADGSLMGTVSLERIASALCATATEGLGVQRVILFVLDRERTALQVADARGISLSGKRTFFLSPALPRNPGLSLRAISRSQLPGAGRPILVPLIAPPEGDEAGCETYSCPAAQARGARCYQMTQEIGSETGDEQFLLRMSHAAVSLVGQHCELCQRERILGVLMADGLQARGQNLEQQCRAFATLADHAAQAVRGAQRWWLSDQQLRTRAEQLRILYDIATATSAALRLDQVLQLILDRSLHYLKACYASVLLFGAGEESTAGGRAEEIRAVRGEDEMGLSEPYTHLERLLARSVLASREACLIASLQDLAERGIEWQGNDFQSALCAPLWAGEEPIGAICVVNRADGAAFAREHLYFLSALARQASVGIHNAGLYEEELAKRQELDRIRSQQSALLSRVFGIQERERRRVAMELHDGPTQTVSALLMGLQICRRLMEDDPRQAMAQLAILEETARQAVADMRHLINDLRPASLDDIGLVSALKQHLRELSHETGASAEFQLEGEEIPLGPGPSGLIFRIIQEAFANAKKHAGAKSLLLAMRFSPRQLRIEFADDGKGLSPSERDGGTLLHFGLLGMKERAQMLSGTLEIRSRPGQGTAVVLTVPVSGPSAARGPAGYPEGQREQD